jgi:hypothetical protein
VRRQAGQHLVQRGDVAGEVLVALVHAPVQRLHHHTHVRRTSGTGPSSHTLYTVAIYMHWYLLFGSSVV